MLYRPKSELGKGVTGVEAATCASCGMEIVRAARASNHPNLCRACERSMNEEEIFAVMDAE